MNEKTWEQVNAEAFGQLVNDLGKRGGEIENICVTGEILSLMDLSERLFRQVRFENCRFLDCALSHAEFTDVTFRHCDLSNHVMDACYFNRCSFEMVKGLGSNLTDATLVNTELSGCQLRLTNWDSATFDKVFFQACDLRDSYLSHGRVKSVSFSEVDLTKASFFKTPLSGIDLRNSHIEGIVVSDTADELKGVIVTALQAAELAKLLGLVVK